MIRPLVYVLVVILSAYSAAAQDSALTETSPAPNPPITEKITFSEVNVDGPYIAMTFDDGPHATNTPKLLEMAAERHIKLTFFVLGECVEQNPDVLRREVAEGHEIGNHSWSHPNLAKTLERGSSNAASTDRRYHREDRCYKTEVDASSVRRVDETAAHIGESRVRLQGHLVGR